MSRTPRASEPESCLTRGSNVVVNRTLVGVGWIMVGLLVRGMVGRMLPPFHQRRPLQATPFTQIQRPPTVATPLPTDDHGIGIARSHPCKRSAVTSLLESHGLIQPTGGCPSLRV